MKIPPKLTKEEFEKLVPDVQQYYAKQEDGSYVLESDGNDDVTNLKTAYDKTKKETLELKDALKAERESRNTDQRKVQELEAKIRANEEKELQQKGEWQTLLDRQKQEYEGKLTQKDQIIAARDKRVSDILLEHATMAAITANKGEPKLLRGIVRDRLYIETDKDGKETVRVYADDGKSMRMHPKNPSDPITPEQFVETLREDEVYARAFDGSGASGSGSQNGNGVVRTANDGSAMTISRADAQNHQKYEIAKKKAQDAGMQLLITDS